MSRGIATLNAGLMHELLTTTKLLNYAATADAREANGRELWALLRRRMGHEAREEVRRTFCRRRWTPTLPQ